MIDGVIERQRASGGQTGQRVNRVDLGEAFSVSKNGEWLG